MPSDKQKSAYETDLYAGKQQQVASDSGSDLLKAIDFLQNPKYMESNTILTDNMQVNAIALMNWAGQVFDIEPFKQYVVNWCKYRISGDNGIGRTQIIQIAEAVRRDKIEGENRMMEMLRGR